MYARFGLQHANRALQLFQALHEPVWEARALYKLGRCSARLGRYEQAGIHCRTALGLLHRYPDYEIEADTLRSLGDIANQTGRHSEAVNCYQQALTVCCDHGYTHGEANTLDAWAKPMSPSAKTTKRAASGSKPWSYTKPSSVPPTHPASHSS